MAGAIQEAKDTGRPVFIVLLTNGVNHRLQDIINGKVKCNWHNTFHNFNLTLDQVSWARKVEFVAAAIQLGVDSIFIAENGSGIDDVLAHSEITYQKFVEKVANVIRQYEKRFPGSSHRMTGRFDVSNNRVQPSHKACWDAANILQNEGIKDFRFYRIYEYYKPANKRSAQFTLCLSQKWLEAKFNALSQYKLFNPEAGRYGLGYHSVQLLIDQALNSRCEYYDLIDFSPDDNQDSLQVDVNCDLNIKNHIYGNHPNPFNSYTTIRFSLEKDVFVELSIFDSVGREVRKLYRGYKTAGFKTSVWNGKDDEGGDVASGIYFCLLRTGQVTKSIKIIVQR